MPVPLDVVCSRRLWCATCRDREGGRAWRADLAAHVALPPDAPDFACPHGAAWGGLPPPAGVARASGQAASPRPSDRWALQGPALWGELHRWALAGPGDAGGRAWLDAFAGRIPCGECRAHWRLLVEAVPPAFGADAFAWTWRAHEATNQRLGKPGLTLEEARAKWEGMATAGVGTSTREAP